MSVTFETTKACACGEEESALTKLWIWCEGCKSWYHSSCVLMEDAEVEDINKKNQDWYCDFVRCQGNCSQ
ncbi:Transcription factor bye1, partial [Pseudolycoriella hygida]